jgi:putative ABC transport system substrate-binding protein
MLERRFKRQARMGFNVSTRRELLALFGAAGLACLRVPSARASERIRRIGALLSSSADDPLSQTVIGAFSQGLQECGWSVGRNVRVEYRWAAVDDHLMRQYAAELIAFAPDVVLAFGTVAAGAIERESREVPIVFVNAGDPVGEGLVESLARPGGRATGFLSIESGMSTKWLQLLKEVAPQVTRVAVIRDPTTVAGAGQFGAIQGAAPSLGVEVTPIDARDNAVIEHAVLKFLRRSNSGLIVTTSRLARHHRGLIIALASRYQLPAVYPNRYYVTTGGLIAYGPDFNEQLRRAAGYVDRILKGENPAELPVEAPTKYELVVNLKTAKALGLTISPTLLAHADEVIE